MFSDIGRVLQMPMGRWTQLAKMVRKIRPIRSALSKAITDGPQFGRAGQGRAGARGCLPRPEA